MVALPSPNTDVLTIQNETQNSLFFAANLIWMDVTEIKDQ
jgi:hypothetical protein